MTNTSLFFSADEFYIMPILITCFIQHLAILFIGIWSAIILRMRQLLHATFKIFLFSVFLHVGLCNTCFLSTN